ncbi:MAG: C40 family peptidase [Actinomycetes bacterium]
MRVHSKAVTAVAVAVVLLIPTTLSGTALGATGLANDKTIPSKRTVNEARAKAQAARGRVAALQTKISASSAKLVTLGANLADASELYNGAVYQEQQAKQKSDAAASEAAAADQKAAATATELNRFASAAYRSGGDIARVSSMLSANGPQDLIDQASTINVLGDRQSSALRRVNVARAAALVLKGQAAQALADQQAATDQVKTSRDKAQGLVDEQQRQANELSAQQGQLRAQVALLSSRSERLAAQRTAGLAARAAAEAAEAAESGTGDGGNLDIPRGILLGMPVNVPEGRQRGTKVGAAKAVAYARAQIGKPYLWAADGPESFDCSGLVLMAWGQSGVSLPHWSVAQYATGKKISLANIRPGDMVFFATDLTEYRSIHHVGLYIGNGQMIEAPFTGSFVRVSSINRASLFGASRP